MKILLVGEYSNVHWTLAEGLRALGHDVTVISDGDRWKGYRRDISLVRHGLSTWGGIRYLARLISLLPKMRGYDIVQLINPVFLDLKAERIMPFYRYLRRNNGKMVMGAFGVDLYWVKAGMDCKTFRYSDFNIGAQPRSNADTTAMRAEWLQGAKGHLNQTIARDCDAIVSGLYENDASYFYYSEGSTVYHSDTAGSKASSSLSAGSTVSALMPCADALIIGRGNFSSSSTVSGGIRKTSLTDGIPGTELIDFDTNASFQISTAYYVTALINTTPDKNEEDSNLYAAITYIGTGTSTSVSAKNKGLWSYYPERGNWNRE